MQSTLTRGLKTTKGTVAGTSLTNSVTKSLGLSVGAFGAKIGGGIS